MQRENKITFYRISKDKLIPGWHVQAASPKRDWMDEYKHMYRCLPMTIANQNGWVINLPCNVYVTWFGGMDRTSMHFWVDPEYNVPNQWVKCHFIGGVVTFEFDFLIHTTHKTNMIVRGAPNVFVDGAHPLEGVVETDWLPYTFTMNWKVTRTNQVVHFKKGMPICFIQPVPHNYSETFDFEIDYLENNSSLNEKYHEWNRQRMAFSEQRKLGDEKREWQRDYFEGRDVKTGEVQEPDIHTSKLNLVNPADQKLSTNKIISTVQVIK